MTVVAADCRGGRPALDTAAVVARDWSLAHPGARAIPTKEA